MQERLQKIISGAGLASRRAAEQMLRDGRVTVNGQTAQLGQSADPEEDIIRVDGERLPRKKSRTYVTAVEEDFTVELPAVCDGGGTVTVMPAEPVRALVRPEDTVALRLELPRFVFPGVLAGDRAGRVTVTVNGVPAGETTLVYREDLPLPDRHRTAV